MPRDSQAYSVCPQALCRPPEADGLLLLAVVVGRAQNGPTTTARCWRTAGDCSEFEEEGVRRRQSALPFNWAPFGVSHFWNVHLRRQLP